MSSVFQDLRQAVRALWKRPQFAATAVLTLALGIGAATAIFTVVYGVLLRPLPYPEPDRIVTVWEVDDDGSRMRLADPNFRDLREQNRTLQGLAEYSGWPQSVFTGDEAVQAMTTMVSRDFFDVMGVQPSLGRAFSPEEHRQGASPVVVVSHSFWRRYLGGDADLSGKTLSVDNFMAPIVGVMPEGFDFPEGTQLWIPRELAWHWTTSRTAHNWYGIGRVRDGVPMSLARQEVTGIARRLKQQFGQDTNMEDVALVPLLETTVGSVRPALLLLLGGAGLLLLIAIANVTGLLLVRAAGRQRELALRLALGAGRRRVLQQSLVESVVLSLVGGALGLLLALWGVKVLLALEPGNLPRLADLRVGLPALLFAQGISLLVAMVLGLWTGLQAAASDLRRSLAGAQRTQTETVAGQRTRSLLVVSQVALTVVLLVGAGLLLRSFLRVLAVDPGYRTGGAVVLTCYLSDPETDEEKARHRGFYERLISRLRPLPGVTEVGLVEAAPLGGGGSNGTFILLNRPDEVTSFEDFERLSHDDARTGYAAWNRATGEYFRAMQIPLLRGRLFDDRDGPTAPHVAVISESLAKATWPDEDPLGKLIQFGNIDGDLRPFTVIGVVGDIRDESWEVDPQPTFYANASQRSALAGPVNLVLVDEAGAASTSAAAQRIVRELDPRVATSVQRLEEVLATPLAARRFSLLLLAVFVGVALLLAAVGVYGVLSYLVAQRRREIAVRMAVGGTAADVTRLVLRWGVGVALAGIAIGLAGGLLGSRLLEGFVYGIEPHDPLTLAAVALVLLGVVALACLPPAWRATRVDPIVTLNSE